MQNTKLILFLCFLLVTFTKNYSQTVTEEVIIIVSFNTIDKVTVNDTLPEYFLSSFFEKIGYQKPNDTTKVVHRSFSEINLPAYLPANATVQTCTLKYSNNSNLYTFKLTEIASLGTTNSAIFGQIGSSSSIHTGLAYSTSQVSIVSASLKTKIQSKITGKLIIGAASEKEDKDNSSTTLEVYLQVKYTRPATPVHFYVKNDMEGFNGGLIKAGPESGTPTQRTSPYYYPGAEQQKYKLAAIDSQENSSYNFVFNNTEAVNNKSEWRYSKDLIDNPLGNTQEYTTEIITTNDEGANYTAFLRKRFKAKTNHDFAEFDSFYPNQDSTFIVSQNSGLISASATKTVNNKQYNFSGWTDDFSASNPRTITPTDNETYTALYKYPYHTNNSNTLDITNQRRFIRAHSDEMYLVYESMDKIWLEWSTDGGSSWNMKNSGKPISEGTAKNPSIAQIGQSEFIITYQERRSDGTYNIMAVLFDGVIRDREILHEQSSKNYTDNATPVIACNRSGIQDFVVLWNEADYGPFSPGGLYYRGGKLVLNGQTGYHEFDFPASANVIANTSENSIEPTTASKLSQSQYPVKFQVAWTHNVSSSSSKINYTIFTVTSSGVTYGSIEEPSSGSGCTKNHSPSMVVMDDNLPRLTWVGERQVEAEEDPSKINGTELSNIEKRVIARGRNSQGTWNPTFFKFGSDVNKVTMNYNESGTIGGYAFAWTENESAPYDYYYVRNTTLYNSPITLYNTSGKYIQLSNGDDLSEMYCMGLGTTSPYAFDLSENLEYTGGQQASKLNSGNFLSIGREGVITNGDNEFYFTIKDVIVEGSEIQFSEVNENTTYADLAEFNSYLTTAPFELNDNSSFYYSVQYGLIEKGSVAATLGENKFINFKVQIVDAQNNNVLGEFDNITYTDENIFQYANIGYEVNTEGIGNKTVKLKLVVDYNIEPIYSLSTLFTEDNLFAKRGIQKVNFEGSLEVTDYQLAQNYPNPFNPVTTINYQIPQDGAVKLVIYDALGREVRTLVNEFKTKGRYEAVFNANDLASGVYIYHLKVNDFVQTRKMMLLK